MNFGYKASNSEQDSHIPTFTITPKMEAQASDSDTYIIPEFTPISDQKSTSSCVANATSDAMEILLALEGKKVEQLSRLFVYWNARHYTGDQNKDAGSYIHLAMQGIQEFGICQESTWSFDLTRVNMQPNLLAFKQASDNTFTAFNKIRSSGDEMVKEIETCIKAQKPVVFGVNIGKELQTYDGNSDAVFDYPEKSIGGHAMVITGVAPDQHNPGKSKFLIRNSWTSDFGLSDYPGHFWASESYLKSFEDCFVGTTIPDLLI